MSWAQWPTGQPAPAVAAAPPLINPAPTVVPPGLPYSSSDQWSQMQQQNWQQWAQWQQQYQQWHQQYGAEYQKSMNALAAQQPVVPNLGVPPPLPMEPQPPLPQDECPKPAPPLPAPVVATQQPPMPQYSTQPPPSNNFSAPPPIFTSTPQQDWRSADNNAPLDQKRPLSQADESPAKRQMMNRQGWRGPANAPGQAPQNWQGQNQSNLEELSEAEKKFDKQFAEWEAQFNKWKDQNSGHPDKQQYKEYEKKWEQWRQQLLERREAMRKKRLGLTAANKAPPNQNFSVPPPPQGQVAANTQEPPPMVSQTIPLQKPPPAPPGPPKEPLLPNADIFSKPPPDMNDEPLQFKKSEGEQEQQEDALGFLSASKSDGIPGLDLVKDGEPDLEDVQDEQVPQKGPDLEAISKGINNILGDQKLMSMLSMVSQTQNVNQSSNGNTMSKINEALPPADQSNLSMDELPNEMLIHSETVQNFDDQTRSSFTMQPNDAEFYRGLPPGGQLNRGGFQANFDGEPPLNRGPPPIDMFDNRRFGGPVEDDFRRPPPTRFGRGIDDPVDDFDQNRGPMNRNIGSFDRAPPGHLGRDDFNLKGPVGLLGPGRRDSLGTSGPGGMTRESFGPGGMDRDFSGTRNMNRGPLGPTGMNRDSSFLGDISRDPLGPGGINRDSFGPESMNRDPAGPAGRNRSLLGAGGINRDSLGPGGMNMGSFAQGGRTRDSFTSSGFNRDSFGPGGMDRDSLESGIMNRDSFGSVGMNRSSLGLGGMNREPLATGGMNREPLGPGGINRELLGPGGINRNPLGPGVMNRDPLGPGGMNREPLGPGGMNRESLGPGGMNRESLGPGGMNRDTLGPRGMNRESLGPGGMNREPLGPGGMNRDSFRAASLTKDSCGPGGMSRDTFGVARLNKEPFGLQSNLNKDKFGPRMNRDEFGPTAPGNIRDRFGPGNREDFGNPSQSNQSRQLGVPPGSGIMTKDRFGPSGREDMGREKYEPQLIDFGGRSQLGRNNLGISRDNFEGRPSEEKLGPRGPGPRRASGDENFGYADGDYENDRADGPGFGGNDFGMAPPNRRLSDGPGGRTDDFGGLSDNFNRGRGNFERMPIGMRTNERPGFRNDRLESRGENFDHNDSLDDEYERGFGRSFSKGEEQRNFDGRDKPPPNRKGDRYAPHDFRDDRESNFRGSFQENFRDEDQRGPSDKGSLRRRNSLLDAPEPPHFNRDPFDDEQFEEEQYGKDVRSKDLRPEIAPAEQTVEELWKPVKVIDYDHKSLKQPEMDILLEPFRMFDYRHKPLDRIPFPERPNWLSDAVRMIPEFDPPLMRVPPMDRRLYDDRFEPPPGRRDERDRMEDRYRHERRGYDRFSPPPSRGKGYDDDNWPSSRGNRSRSPLRFEKPPPVGDRMDRERADRGGRNRSRERGRDWEPKSRNREGSSRDWETEKEDYKGGSKDWGGRDERRDRGDRDDYRDRGGRDRGRDWKGTANKEDSWKNRDKEWEERGRQWEEESVEMNDKDRNKDRDGRYRNDRNIERGSDRNDYNKRTGGEIFPLSKPVEEKKPSNVTLIEDLINPPGRSDRPQRIVIILRGPPGSGKTYLAKLIKDKEVENGGSAPRILSLDDYFMVEQEREVMEDGKRIKTKDMVYEFEAEMEESYRASLMRSFKKTITDGYFSFIVVDNVNDKVKHFGEMWSFAKQNGFQVYVGQLDLDVQNCTKRNIHNRTEDEIRKCVEGWEDTPAHHSVVDVSFLAQEEPISEVEMEEVNSPGSGGNGNEEGSEIKSPQDHLDRSKWDNFDCSINNLARLDGVNKPLRTSRTMEEYLQLDDQWQPAKSTKPGQKRVRWADLEERKQQEKMRAIGFVVGQTDWERMMDPTLGESALTQTKYIEKTQRRRF